MIRDLLADIVDYGWVVPWMWVAQRVIDHGSLFWPALRLAKAGSWVIDRLCPPLDADPEGEARAKAYEQMLPVCGPACRWCAWEKGTGPYPLSDV